MTTSTPPEIDLRWRVYGIRVDRSIVRHRIRTRLEDRLDGGMIDEVRGLLAAGVPHARLAALGLEYREIDAYLAGRKPRAAMIDDLALAIGRFAKRQDTWFRGMERRGTPITWIEPGDSERILSDLRDWVRRKS